MASCRAVVETGRAASHRELRGHRIALDTGGASSLQVQLSAYLYGRHFVQAARLNVSLVFQPQFLKVL